LIFIKLCILEDIEILIFGKYFSNISYGGGIVKEISDKEKIYDSLEDWERDLDISNVSIFSDFEVARVTIGNLSLKIKDREKIFNKGSEVFLRDKQNLEEKKQYNSLLIEQISRILDLASLHLKLARQLMELKTQEVKEIIKLARK